MVFDLELDGVSVTEDGKDVRAGALWESMVRTKGDSGRKGQEAHESLREGSRGTRAVWA